MHSLRKHKKAAERKNGKIIGFLVLEKNVLDIEYNSKKWNGFITRKRRF